MVAVSPMTVRLELFPKNLDSFLAFYTRVLRFTPARDERTAPSPYVSVHRDSVYIGAVKAWEPTDPGRRLPPQASSSRTLSSDPGGFGTSASWTPRETTCGSLLGSGPTAAGPT